MLRLGVVTVGEEGTTRSGMGLVNKGATYRFPPGGRLHRLVASAKADDKPMDRPPCSGLARSADMTAGWMVGILVEIAGESAPVRHFYAVAKPDRARAEWAAVDRVGAAGAVSASPSGGMEPVEALAAIPSGIVKAMGLTPGEVRALGRRWPRRWIGNEKPDGDEGSERRA